LKLSPEIKEAYENPSLISNKVSSDIEKNIIFSFDFNFKEFLNSLTLIELLAFGNFIFNQIILSYTISIVLILYGDYLLKRFDLVNK
jgi:hypothetical protein